MLLKEKAIIQSNFFHELQVFYYWHNSCNLADQIMDLRTQSDIMGNLRAKGLAIMSLNVTPSLKSKDWAKWSVVLAYSGKRESKSTGL